MRRRLESLLPLLVLLSFLAAAVAVDLLLADAQEHGVDALDDAVGGEVQAIAASQDQRFEQQFESVRDTASSGLGQRLQFEVGSDVDREILEPIVSLLPPDAESGFYLLDPSGVITQGVLLADDAIGTTFDWPGFEALAAAADPATGGVLPVATGLTTDQPAVAFVFPVLDPATGAVRGRFVSESVVAAGSDFNREISSLRRGETGEYLFYDDEGTVVASNDPSLIARPLGDERLIAAPVGVHRFDGQVVAIAEVPTAGWRVAFRQDADEFERALARPVESVGRILILTLLGAGFVFTVLLNRRLKAARAEQERLRRLSEAQQEFISIVSHELRTPVAGVLGFLETTLDHWEAMDDADRKRAVGRAAANARRLQAMTRDVLDTESVEAGRLVHVLQPLDLAAEVAVAVEASRELDVDRVFEVRRPDDPVWVSGDADRLQQVLANLLENARKNSPAVEPIVVELRADGGVAELAVTDRGAGIPEEALERIFEKFVRGRDDLVTGTGLGLYIARQIMDAHGGRIWARSEAGMGATFTLTLPLIAPPEPAVAGSG